MKKTFLLFGLFAGSALFALQPSDKLSVQDMSSRIESMRNFEWAGNKHELLSYLYPLYYTATANSEQALELEKKLAGELLSGQGNLRYKMLLAQSLEISGIQQSAMALAEEILKASKAAENQGWCERVISALGSATDPDANKALLKIFASASEPLKISAMSALSTRKAGFKEAAGVLNSQIASGFKSLPLTYASIAAMANIGGENAMKGLALAYRKAKSSAVKLAASTAYFTAASELKKPSAAAESFAAEIMSDKQANLSSRLQAYAYQLKTAKASKPESRDFELLAIDLLRMNPNLPIPSFLSLQNLDEAAQTMLVQVLTDRGVAYDEIIKLNPKTPELAEAIARAAAKMGSQKDYQKLLSFAPLFGDKRAMRAISIYIADINGENKTHMLSALQKGADASVSDLISATLENLDSSSAATELIAQVKSGDTASQLNAIKTLSSAQAKAPEIFVALCGIYPSVKDAGVLSAMQRLMVAESRLSCNDAMLKAAIEQFNATKDAKTRNFFIRFASETSSKAAADFLAGVYAKGMKNEALREFAKWKNDTAFDALMGLEKANPSDKAKIRDIMVSVLTKNALFDSPVVKYISSTAINERERNLLTMLEVPTFGENRFVDVGGGMKAIANRGGGDVKRAFDGNMSTRWASNGNREPGIGFMVELPQAESVKGVELMLGNSRGDRVLEPKVFIGESPTNLRKAEVKYSKAADKDVLTFAKPEKFKVICIVNTQESGGFWSIYEFKFIK